MILLFGASSKIGEEYRRQSQEEVLCVSRSNIEHKNDNSTIMIKASIEELANDMSLINSNLRSQITTIVFAHRYRPLPSREGIYDIHESIKIEIEAPAKIIEKLQKKNNSLKTILFISSIGGEYVALEQPYAYGLTKICVQKLAKDLAVRLSERQITVNTLILGYVKQGQRIKRDEGFFNTAELVIPSRCVPDPKEIAQLMHDLVNLGLSNQLFTAQEIYGDACLTKQTHSAVAEQTRAGLQTRFKY